MSLVFWAMTSSEWSLHPVQFFLPVVTDLSHSSSSFLNWVGLVCLISYPEAVAWVSYSCSWRFTFCKRFFSSDAGGREKILPCS